MKLELKKVSFNKDESCDFISVLRERINLYFKNRQLSPKAGFFMYLKSIFLTSLVVINYAAILADFGAWSIGLYVLLGFFISFSTMNIAHDALHGSYLSRSFGNRILGLTMDLSGASSFYWKKEHTIDHHTFTNIVEHDADLDVPIVLRLCPKAPYRSFHRFQQWYAPFLYSLNFIHWIYYSDPKRIYRIFKDREKAGNPSKKEVFLLILFKIIHIFVFLGVPIMTLTIPLWQVLIGYLSFLATAGIVLTTIFQLAHIVENVAFPLPNEHGKMENSFAKHQLSTTSNFAMKNKIVSFLFGGLNFQIEHHLFPHICHTHLYKIAPIVESTAKEFGLPYHQNFSFFSALRSHFNTLKKLGKSPPTV